MKTWMQIVAAGVLFSGTAALAIYHHQTGAFEWYEWLGTHEAALQVWGITLRLIGVVNMICFASLWPQVIPFASRRGMQPVNQVLKAIARDFPTARRFMYYPTLLWFNDSDLMLRLITGAGGVAGAAIALGWGDSRAWFALAYVCMLSLDLAMGMAYPWDCYLIETNFLCVFFPALLALPSLPGDWSGVGAAALATTSAPSPLASFLWRWLAYRLMFGFGKLKFTATTDKDDLYIKSFWVNMPMATAFGWAGFALPNHVHIANLAVMWLVEIVVPFLYFLSGWPSVVAAIGVLGLQVGIHATGNFGWFNVLSAFAALPLLLHTSSVWTASFGADGAILGAARALGAVADSALCGAATPLLLAAGALGLTTAGAPVCTATLTPAAVQGASALVASLGPLWGVWDFVWAHASALVAAPLGALSTLAGSLPFPALYTAAGAVSYAIAGPSAEFEMPDCLGVDGVCVGSDTGAPGDNNLSDSTAHAWLWVVAVTIILPGSLWHLPLNSWVTGGFTYWPALAKLQPSWFWTPLFTYLRLVGSHWRMVHAYGVFPPNSSPAQRLVPVFEGSADGKTWRQWEYHYMAINAKSPPVFVAPHTPRLDHGIFYDSLGINGTNHMMFTGDRTPWGFAPTVTPAKRLAARLLEGSDNPVYSMFKTNPFPDPSRPPKFVRVSLYRLVRTDVETLRATGDWWRAAHIAEHLPAISAADIPGVWSQWLSPPEQWFPTSQVWRQRVGWTRRGVTAPEYEAAWALVEEIRNASRAAVVKGGDADRIAALPSPAQLAAVGQGSGSEGALTPEHMAALFSYDLLGSVRVGLLEGHSQPALHDAARVMGALTAPLLARLTAIYGRVPVTEETAAAEAEEWKAWRGKEGSGANAWEWGSAPARGGGRARTAASAAPGSEKESERKLDVFAQAVMVGIGDTSISKEAAAAATAFITGAEEGDWEATWAAVRGVSKQPPEGVEPRAFMSTPLKMQCYAHYLILAGGRSLYERAVGGAEAVVGGHPLPMVWPPRSNGPTLGDAPTPPVYEAWAATPPPLVQTFLDTACPAVHPGCWGGSYPVGFFLEALLNFDSAAALAEKWRLMDSISRKSTQSDPEGGILPGFMEVVVGLRNEPSLRLWNAHKGRFIHHTILADYDCDGPTGEWLELGDGREAAGRDFGGKDVILPWE